MFLFKFNSENRKKQPNKASQLQKIEKTAAELYKKMRYLNTTYNHQVNEIRNANQFIFLNLFCLFFPSLVVQ